MARVAINGLGRIGRAVMKIVLDRPDDFDLVAINDLVTADNLAYLLKFDSVYGRYPKNTIADGESIVIDEDRYRLYSEKDPANLPWSSLDVDFVFECTGKFKSRDDLQKHIGAGSKCVLLSTQAKGDIPTVVYGVNEPPRGAQVVSCASCTTNCIAPVAEIMKRRIGVKKAVMTTIHAYTSSQSIVDSPNKKMTRGRAGAINLVPTSTGAAEAAIKVLPEYEGRFDGVAIRAPIPVGSLSDLVFVTERPTDLEEINDMLEEEADSERYRDVVETSADPVVSSDIIMNPHASIIDLNLTQVIDGDLVKIFAWYDNEWGYASQMVRLAAVMARQFAGASA